ncbi:hypothetical protein [Dermabacter hominis]|uniref:hypothetical protein n=1 Tax=Dermabacter hominis TaxID=36740 RepID=UPI0021A717BD|nr:hypothetical protein [Dermabacter hominis]MCT1790640.1 hypothetical protein [Dermabacter hominis]
MRAYPVIIYTEPATNQTIVSQIDDDGISFDVEYPDIHCDVTSICSVPSTRKGINIKATAIRTVEATDLERIIADLARVFGKEIARLKEHARDERERGFQEGKRYALTRVRDLLEPEDDDEEEA